MDDQPKKNFMGGFAKTHMEKKFKEDLIEALDNIGTWIKYLGIGDANSQGWGAIEALSKSVMDGFAQLSRSIDCLADAIREIGEKED